MISKMVSGQQKPVLVLGLGNDLLKDDGAGIKAARKLRAILDPSVDCLETGDSGLALLDYLVAYKKIIIIDAIYESPEKAGEVFEWRLEDGDGTGAFSPHYMGLREIKKIAQWLDLPFPKEIKVMAIAVKDPFTISQEISPEVEGAIDRVVWMVRKIISAWLN